MEINKKTNCWKRFLRFITCGLLCKENNAPTPQNDESKEEPETAIDSDTTEPVE